MLVIRAEQMLALQSARRKVFKKRLYDDLSASSQAGLTYALYDAQVDDFLSLANECGFVTELDCALLARLVYRISGGLDIESLPIASQNVLYEYKAKPPFKLERLQRLHAVAPAKDNVTVVGDQDGH